MSDRSEFNGDRLPPDLAELDAELSSIRYEERPSFGPELEAELAREWRRVEGKRHLPVRQLLAASVVGLLMVGFGVPSARASLVRLVGSLQGGEAEEVEPAQPAPSARSIPAFPFEVPASLVPEERATDPEPTSQGGPPPGPTPVDRYEGPEATFPELLDRPGTEVLIRRYYPVELQQEGIGGTVGLRLWVASSGRVEVAELASSSGVPALDRAALDVAPSFGFEPARRRGRTVGTWVEFDVRFEVVAPGSGPIILPEIRVPPRSGTLRTPAFSVVREQQGDGVPSPGAREAEESLRSAIGDNAVVRRLGPVEAILWGDPPAGAAPTRWKADVSEALEAAITRDPDNPTPLLALARIRHKQGLPTEARVLLERGLQRARGSGSNVSPTVLADLHYERGMLVRESWLATRNSGRVPADALPDEECRQARSSADPASGYVSAERLIAWNYLCPVALGRVLEASFDPIGQRANSDLTVMIASFRSAMDASPAHVGANVGTLLTFADAGRWLEVLDGARRFVRASNGHPHGLLLTGLALQRLARPEEALAQFQLAFQVMPSQQVRELEDVRHLLTSSEAEEYGGLAKEEWAPWVDAFWRPLDPILSTAVNERRVEHLARTSYALLRFGEGGTDAGQVWIRYGGPSEVRVVSGGSGLRTEFWDYGTGGPDLTFRRLAVSDDLAFTPEGRAYMDELRRVFAHRYGAESRMVVPLRGQVSHFREGRGASTWHVVTEVPDLPATAEGDTLDLSVFFVGSEGDRFTGHQREVPALGEPIAFEVTAGPEGASVVVVEVFNRRTGQAAVLRHEAGSSAAKAGLGISDLLLAHAADPSGPDLSRGAAWVRPHVLGGAVESSSVGVIFELYDVPEAVEWYRLRAEIENRDTGEIRAVSVKPAGESDYRPTWDRRPTDRGRTVEFANVWVDDVPEGRYLLRIWADLPEAGTPLVAERAIELR
jgi:TonB family protein